MLKNILFCSFLLFARPLFCNEIVNLPFLSVFDSSDPETPDSANTFSHKKIEMLFNFYGQKIEYLDIHENILKNKLNEAFVKQYKGIIFWFRYPKSNDSKGLISLLEKFIDQKKKIMVFGEWPFIKNQQGIDLPSSLYDPIFSKLGLRYENIYYGNSVVLKLSPKHQPKLVEFERKLDNEVLEIDLIKNVSKHNQTWLSVKNELTGEVADVIVVGKDLLYAQRGFDLFENPIDDKTQWRINPFAALENFLEINTEIYPILDTTTLNGKRIWFNHIDGDGILNQGRSDQEKKCGEIIYQEILKKYDVPHTVSVIEAEIAPNGEMPPSIKEMVGDIFQLDNVEMASHTYTHPLSWAKKPSLFERENYLGKNSKKEGPILSFPQKNYFLNYSREIEGSLNFINKNFESKNKKANIILWSGSCRPPAEALEVVQKNNYLNINGGDSRMDRFFPSYSHVAPLYRKKGGMLQVYTANGNENIYTNLWEGPYEGLQDVLETFKNTETPIRLRPVNIYYHFYSGEYLASLNALKKIYDWTSAQNYNSIFTSDYIQMIQDFERSKIFKINSQHFRIESEGKIRTVKFKTKLFPDYLNSSNILGHQFFQNYLWIYLGDKTKSDLLLTSSKPKSPYLISSDGFIDQFKVLNSSIEIIGKSYTSGFLNYFDGKKEQKIKIKKGLINIKVKRQK